MDSQSVQVCRGLYEQLVISVSHSNTGLEWILSPSQRVSCREVGQVIFCIWDIWVMRFWYIHQFGTFGLTVDNFGIVQSE
jgi:hypothetical protein